jgi:hypothetical protein
MSCGRKKHHDKVLEKSDGTEYWIKTHEPLTEEDQKLCDEEERKRKQEREREQEEEEEEEDEDGHVLFN